MAASSTARSYRQKLNGNRAAEAVEGEEMAEKNVLILKKLSAIITAGKKSPSGDGARLNARCCRS